MAAVKHLGQQDDDGDENSSGDGGHSVVQK